jgi:creatinine amidohydrolase/Fe(II)-dependent formamide hydrolase-like protein
MKADADCDEWGHACEWETSMAMMACPELVHLDALGERTFPTLPPPNVGVALTPVDWIARHPYMAVGEPQKASREKGERWLDMVTTAVVDHLRLIKKDDRTLQEMQRYRERAHNIV